MDKDNNIVSRRDYLEVIYYLFNSDMIDTDEIKSFNSFWKKYIKNKSIPFGNLDLFKTILKKYDKYRSFYGIEYYYIKFESLYLILKPNTDKDINIFLNLCDILIQNSSISMDLVEDFYNLFEDKDNLLNVIAFIKKNDDLSDDIIVNFDSIINILKKIRYYFLDEKDFCQIILFILEVYIDGTDLIFNIDEDNLEDSLCDLIYKTIINNNYNDKLNILEKLKSLRDKYKNIEKRNNILSENINKYNEALSRLESYLDEEFVELKKQEKVQDSSDSIKNEYMQTYTNYSPNHNKYHNKFDLVAKCLFMNNYVCLSGPKECGKKTMVEEFKDVFSDYKFISYKYENLITIYQSKNYTYEELITTINVFIPDVYDVLVNGGVLSIEIGEFFEENSLLNDLINASKNLNNYIKVNNNLIKINPNFRLCIINHNNQEFNKYIKNNSIVNVECDYDEKLEEELTSNIYMDFFREYRKDLKNYNIILTTKDIVFPRNSYEMIDFFNKIDLQISEKTNNQIGYYVNYYINLTQNYDPSNLLYNLFNEWQKSKEKGIGVMMLDEEHQKTLIKRMK